MCGGDEVAAVDEVGSLMGPDDGIFYSVDTDEGTPALVTLPLEDGQGHAASKGRIGFGKHRERQVRAVCSETMDEFERGELDEGV